MLTNIIFYFLLAIVILFALYEHNLHKQYKKDLNNERFISFFFNARMQVVRMLHINEISPNSAFFNFMMRATSYSIRTIKIHCNKKIPFCKMTELKEILPFVLDSKMKEEFKTLNREQKELFVRTIISIVILYVDKNFIEKAFLMLYLQAIKERVCSAMFNALGKFSGKGGQKKFSYINEINENYNLSEYAAA